MTKFIYTARNEKGKTVEGRVEADTKDSALEILKKQHLRPIGIKKEGGFDPNNLSLDFILPKRVKRKDLVIFTRQLSTMINAGVPLVRSLATLQGQTENKFFKETLEKVSKDVESGLGFAESLGKHPKVFSDVYVNMVAAGEAGGLLDDILKKLAVQQEKEESMVKKVKSASTYPIVLLTITFGAFFGLMLFGVPRIGVILKDLGGPDAELPIYTQAMLNLSDFMLKNAIFGAIGIGVGLYLFRRWIKTEKGKVAWHTFILKVPILGNVIKKVTIARFARTFASMMSSGVAVLDSLTVTGRALGNRAVQIELEKAAEQVKNGKQLSEPLSESKIFPAIVSDMLAVGEETGQVDTILVKVADAYEEEVDALLDSLVSIIEPVMIVIMGAMVGVIAISVMGPIANISQNIR